MMTINVPIRPGAALSDPETYRHVESSVLNVTYDVVTRRSWIPDRAYNKDGIVNVLANFPWQEYGYKFGRWQRVPVIQELPIFQSWRSWEKKYHALMITDPATGREIAELTGIVKAVQAPTGRLLFAGDPHYAGVISTIIDDKRHMSIVGSTRLVGNPAHSPEIAKRARDLTKTIVPSHPPQVRLHDPTPDYLKYLGPWIADHPDKPSKPS
jgi:hypothetical protein